VTNPARLRVGVHGATGRMGRMVLEQLEAAPDVALAWACGRTLPDDVSADVIIDFSTPDGLRALLQRAPRAVVSGTTGLVVPDAPGVALLHAANFSLGVAVLARLAREAARALPEWDVEVVETHHIRKLDAPSGTALRLADAVQEGRRAPMALVHGRTGPRVPGSIGMHALRGGDVVGEHTVHLFGPNERITLGHVASTRDLFAAGAVRCARWLHGRPAGRYTVEDVLER
jgi:4-hydroxy-tetrahydrodipicolinate reductase